MQRTRKRSFWFYAIVIAILVILPILFLFFVNIGGVTKFVKCRLSMEPYQLFESSINYLSLAATILLGIVVYRQEQKINDLESSQYEVFLGVVGLDNDYSLGDFLLAGKCPPNPDFVTLQSYSSLDKSFLTSLHFDSEKSGKPEVIPLVFLVKSCTLITAMHFQKIALEIASKNSVHYQKEFICDDTPVYGLFEDNSKFSLGIGITLPEEVEIDEIKVGFSVTINDQICRVHTKTIEVELKKVNDKFLLSSSKTS